MRTVPLDRPGEPERPEQPEKPEQPERIERPERELAPDDRADLERLAETSERWADLDRYDGNRANLSNPDKVEAATYVRDNADSRPWLEPASHRAVDIQRGFVSMDLDNGHQLERHEGYADDEKLERRVTRFEDPAQVDPEKRAMAVDGTTGKRHHCAEQATAIQDAEMFTVAFIRGIEWPDVRAVLDRSELGERPDAVEVPIEALLGPDGDEHCSGYRLAPIDGSIEAAKEHRKEWAAANRAGDTSGLEPPRAEPIESFEGGTIVFAFGLTADKENWGIVTMYPEPPK